MPVSTLISTLAHTRQGCLAAVFILAVAMATPHAAFAAEKVEGGSFKILVNRDLDGFDHVRAPSPETGRLQILFAIHDLLFRYDPRTGTLTPRLAVKATPNADHTRWQVVLREGVRFSNGEALTAEAYSHHFTRLLRSPLADQFRAVLGLPLSEVAALDTHTIEFRFSAPAVAFDVIMGHPLYVWFLNAPGVAKQNEDRPDYNTVAVGAGPYMLKQWVPGQSVTLVKNQHYWNPSEQHADELIFHVVAGAERAGGWAALRAGDVDVAFTAGDLIGWGRTQSELTFLEGFRSYIGFILNFNAGKEPFDDARVRRALVHAVNRKAVVDVSMRGGGQLGDQSFSPGEKWHCSGLDYPAFDPAKARALLKDYGKPLPSFDIWTLPGQPQAAAEAIQAMWRDVGVRAEIKVIGPAPGALFAAIARGEPAAWMQLGGPALHPTTIHMNMHASDKGNAWRIKSARLDQAIDKVMAARGDADIKAAHCAFEQAKAEEAPLIYLSYGMAGLFHKKTIGGIEAPYSALYDLHRLHRVR